MAKHTDIDKDRALIEGKTITVKISNDDILDKNDIFQTHRELVAATFRKQGFVVINWNELRYHYRPKFIAVEGINGQSVLKM